MDPFRLAKRQMQIDRERTGRFPHLLDRKQERMSASPLAFLRGAAPLFYEMLKANEELGAGPGDVGWIVGDAHLENFGAYRPALPASTPDLSTRKTATFNLNDFDDAVKGPWRWDVLRLSTSLLLAGRELGVSGMAVLSLCERLIQSYVDSAFGGAPLPRQPRPVAALVEQVAMRSKKELLDARTSVENGRRRFLRGPRYRDLPRDIAAQVPKALETYAGRLPASERPERGQLEIVDVAFRIAGTGSLGALRIAVLTHGKGGIDGGWIFDLKEQFRKTSAPSRERLRMPPAARVEMACRAFLAQPPRMLATTELGNSSMIVRRLAPQEDKLDLGQLKEADLPPLASYLGTLLGMAHALASRQQSRVAWTRAEQGAMLERAVTCAGLHEAIYLELCLLLHSTPRSSRPLVKAMNASPATGARPKK
jgi:uncharacterized protein (DUF2252 family)